MPSATNIQLFQVVSIDPFRGRWRVTTHKTEAAAQNEFSARSKSRHLDARIVPAWSIPANGRA